MRSYIKALVNRAHSLAARLTDPDLQEMAKQADLENGFEAKEGADDESDVDDCNYDLPLLRLLKEDTKLTHRTLAFYNDNEIVSLRTSGIPLPVHEQCAFVKCIALARKCAKQLKSAGPGDGSLMQTILTQCVAEPLFNSIDCNMIRCARYLLRLDSHDNMEFLNSFHQATMEAVMLATNELKDRCNGRGAEP